MKTAAELFHEYYNAQIRAKIYTAILDGEATSDQEECFGPEEAEKIGFWNGYAAAKAEAYKEAAGEILPKHPAYIEAVAAAYWHEKATQRTDNARTELHKANRVLDEINNTYGSDTNEDHHPARNLWKLAQKNQQEAEEAAERAEQEQAELLAIFRNKANRENHTTPDEFYTRAHKAINETQHINPTI
jgi:hypothetical protein